MELRSMSPEVKFTLLRDRENPRMLHQLGRGLAKRRADRGRTVPLFQDAMASIWRVLESGDISTLDLVASVS